jgi:glycosyltransferase involved in cell wall biosynthesis
MKVLATAYACEPGQGSEAGIGWNWARQIARRHELVLITRENNVDAIERAARAEGLGLTVVGYDLPRWARCWKRGGRGAVAYFYLWQRSLARLARRLDRQHDFDVVQHLTFASSWIPSGLATLGKPFVWGPVGQHPAVPSRFMQPGDLRGRLAERAKAAVRSTLLTCDPALGRTLEAADVILSLGREFSDRVPARWRAKVEPMLACGTQPSEMVTPRTLGGGPFEVLFAGRLIELKGVRLALEAFAELHAQVPARLTLLGEGPLRGALETRARELGIADDVVLRGNLPHAEALRVMHSAHVFLFPSFEGAGMVVPEAMAAGNPVVCLDFGGPGEMVGDERGIAVALQATPEDTARALAGALLDLARDEQRRLGFAQRALEWARRETSWEAKGARLEDIYARVCPEPALNRKSEVA